MVEPPDLRMRISILRRKDRAENFGVPNDVLVYIANQFEANRQELEEALIRVVAYSSLLNRDIEVELAKEALAGVFPINKQRRANLRATGWSKSIAALGAFTVATVSSMVLLSGCNTTKEITGNAAAAEVKQGNPQQNLTLSGRTEPFEQVLLSPLVSGNVKDIFAELGSYVTKGQKLAQLDEGDLVYRMKQAESLMKKNEAEAHVKEIDQQINLNKTNADLSTDSSKELMDAKSTIINAQVALADAQKNWQRMNSLFQQGAIPQQQLEQAQTQKVQIENQLNQAKQMVSVLTSQNQKQKEAGLATVKLQGESAAASESLANLGIESTKTDLEMIRYQYNNLVVKAPINGFVTDKKAIVGSAVSTETPMFVITNLDKVNIKIDVPEAMINRLKMNQTATVTFPTVGKTGVGRVVYIGQLADLSSGSATYPVKVMVDNTNHEIKGGMLAQVTINK
jgi:HlyD family secretion protein